MLMKLASLRKTSCFPGIGCFSACSQASLKVLFSDSKVCFGAHVMVFGTSAFEGLWSGLKIKISQGIKFL